jgi:hypothetical protein
MEHNRHRITGSTLAHRFLSFNVFAEYYTTTGHIVSVREGDTCRLDWYDTRQGRLF